MNSENKRMFLELTNKANEVGKKMNIRNVGKNLVILMEKHKNKKGQLEEKIRQQEKSGYFSVNAECPTSN